MRKDGTLESWDDLGIFAYKEEVGPVGEMYRTAKQKRDGGADIDEGMGLIDECLQDYQGFHYQRENDKYMIRFPFANYLSLGQKVKCIDTGAEFVIKWVEKQVKRVQGELCEVKTGRVRVSGPHEPEEQWRLRFAEPDRIAFFKGQPANVAGSYVFDQTTDLKRGPASFTDTITCRVTERMPGSLDKKPFGPNKELKHRFREYVRNDTDFTVLSAVTGQLFDNVVQFSMWSTRNRRADILLEWFESFMVKYAWVLKWNGIQEVFYWQRTPDAKVVRWRDDIIQRTVEFYFRTEKHITHTMRRLTSVTASVDVLTHGESHDSPAAADPLEWPVLTGIVPMEVLDGTGVAIT
jgi:hypothetical protein